LILAEALTTGFLIYLLFTAAFLLGTTSSESSSEDEDSTSFYCTLFYAGTASGFLSSWLILN